MKFIETHKSSAKQMEKASNNGGILVIWRLNILYLHENNTSTHKIQS